MSQEISTERKVSPAAFAMGMFTIAASFWRQISKEQIEVFYQILGAEMNDSEWALVVKESVRTRDDSSFPPTPGQMLATLDEIRLDQREQAEERQRRRRMDEWVPPLHVATIPPGSEL